MSTSWSMNPEARIFPMSVVPWLLVAKSYDHGKYLMFSLWSWLIQVAESHMCPLNKGFAYLITWALANFGRVPLLDAFSHLVIYSCSLFMETLSLWIWYEMYSIFSHEKRRSHHVGYCHLHFTGNRDAFKETDNGSSLTLFNIKLSMIPSQLVKL